MRVRWSGCIPMGVRTGRSVLIGSNSRLITPGFAGERV